MTTTKKASTTSPARAWDEVGEQWQTLGRHVGTRLEKARATASEDRTALERSLREMLASIEDALAQAGGLVRDRKLRNDLAELAQRVHDAVQATIGSASSEIRHRLPSAPRRGAKSKAEASGSGNGRRPVTKKAELKKSPARAAGTRAKGGR